MKPPVIPMVPWAPLPPGRPCVPAAAPEACAQAMVAALLGSEPRRRDLLIEHLHKIQDRLGHLPQAHLAALAAEMALPVAEVCEVARAYDHFEVLPPGQAAPAALTVKVCDSLSCEMAGARRLLAALPDLLGSQVRVMAAPCLGRCEQAPAVVLGQRQVAPASAEAVAHACRQVAGGPPDAGAQECIRLQAYRGAGGYRLLRSCLSGARDAESVLHALEASGQWGWAGAGADAAWRALRAEPGPKLMLVDFAEAQPGAFKDRVLLERDPHRFLEGLLLVAWAVGADAVYLPLRGEYHGCRQLLTQELAQLAQALPMAELPPLHLRRSAGAQAGHQASAVWDWVEGRQAGAGPAPGRLFGLPTLVQGVEALYWVRELLERGGEWFASRGRHGRKGLRSFAVSGRVREPGLKLAPAGITVQELIDEYCGGMLPGHQFYAYLPGGASGGMLPARLNDIPLDFGTLEPYGCDLGCAAVIVLSDQDSALAAARSVMRHAWPVGGASASAPNALACLRRYFPQELR